MLRKVAPEGIPECGRTMGMIGQADGECKNKMLSEPEARGGEAAAAIRVYSVTYIKIK
jgi:hypothetical protein